jgi:hypothetical protein
MRLCGLLAAGLAVSACAAEEPVAPPAYSEAMNPSLQSMVQEVLADAAQRTGIDQSMLKVVSAEAVTWSDGSLGCPQPGMMYTQALVPGYRVRVQAAEQVLDYHASARGGLALCPAGRAVEPAPGDSI